MDSGIEDSIVVGETAERVVPVMKLEGATVDNGGEVDGTSPEGSGGGAPKGRSPRTS